MINRVTKSLLSLMILVIIAFTNFGNTFDYKIYATDPSIDGIQCGAMEQLGYHIHTHLDIFVNSHQITVPSLIGITDSCFYWLHTHDQSGIIHIESPVKKEFTLGQFIDIWGKKYYAGQIFSNTITDNKKLTTYINGDILRNGTDLKDIVFHPHDEIAIIYGKSPNFIPSKYDFTQGL